MVDTYLAPISVPQTPTPGFVKPYVDSTTGRPAHIDENANAMGILSRSNAIASQGPGFATDTYVTSSGIRIPSCGMKAGQLFRWFITASKTAAGTAAAVYTLRLGVDRAVTDAAVLALTAGAQTAAADSGTLIVTASVRNIAASGVIAGAASWSKTQAGTAGLGGSIDGVSSGFDNTQTATAGQILGISINGGASAAWTITSVASELIG